MVITCYCPEQVAQVHFTFGKPINLPHLNNVRLASAQISVYPYIYAEISARLAHAALIATPTPGLVYMLVDSAHITLHRSQGRMRKTRGGSIVYGLISQVRRPDIADLLHLRSAYLATFADTCNCSHVAILDTIGITAVFVGLDFLWIALHLMDG